MLVPYMSDILLNVFLEILEGTYVARNFRKILSIEDQGDEEFEFSPSAKFDGQDVRRVLDEEPVAMILTDFQQIAYDDVPEEEKQFIKDFKEYAKQ